MSRVYVGNQRGGGFVGWANRLVTRSRLGHSLIAFEDGRYYSANATPSLVWRRWHGIPYPAVTTRGWVRGSVADIQVPTRWQYFEATPDQVKAMVVWNEERLGWPYGAIGCLRFTTVWRLFFASREGKRYRRELFCSKGVHACPLETIDLNLLGEFQSWEVAPAHFRASGILRRGAPKLYRGPVL